ncbi:hypothetical protein [Nocardia sp. JCM 34519]|uniref:hypothetical protein n=1 Tax=Nocardia sp. JCM 34519 TaxID=2876118 RepID=UPI001CE429BC|nr:hypothetical protein [Nocardia sp. JCM 34519]
MDTFGSIAALVGDSSTSRIPKAYSAGQAMIERPEEGVPDSLSATAVAPPAVNATSIPTSFPVHLAIAIRNQFVLPQLTHARRNAIDRNRFRLLLS